MERAEIIRYLCAKNLDAYQRGFMYMVDVLNILCTYDVNKVSIDKVIQSTLEDVARRHSVKKEAVCREIRKVCADAGLKGIIGSVIRGMYYDLI